MPHIQQYFYTRLPKEDSPNNKYGFQSVFVPEKYQDRSFILELESRIHYPEYDDFSGKQSVFYRDIEGERCLVILNMTLLPDARDEQGRGGIFMVQGFIVPPEIHRRARGPLSLFERILRPHLYENREQGLADSHANRKTGIIQPLNVDESILSQLDEDEAIAELSQKEKELMSFIVKKASGDLNDWSLVLRGHPAEVSNVMNRIFALLPTIIREATGWDPGFDGGKIFFSPFDLFGYYNSEPVTGQALIFDLNTEAFNRQDLSGQLLTKEYAYDQFIARRLSAPYPDQTAIDAKYQLLTALHKGEGVPPNMDLDEPTAELLGELLPRYIARDTGPILRSSWARLLADEVGVEGAREILNTRLNLAVIGKYLDRAITRQNVKPAVIENELPKAVIAQAPPRLQLLHAMWTGEAPAIDPIRQVSPDALVEALHLMASTDLIKQKWFFPFVAQFPIAFHRLTDEHADFRDPANKWMKKQVPRSHRSMKNELVDYINRNQQFQVLADERPDWNSLLEGFLKEGKYKAKELQKLLTIAEKTGLSPTQSPLLNAYTYPKDTIPTLISRSDELRERFAEALVVAHDFSKKELKKMGFEAGEIARAVRSRRGIYGKIKTLLGM